MVVVTEEPGVLKCLLLIDFQEQAMELLIRTGIRTGDKGNHKFRCTSKAMAH